MLRFFGGCANQLYLRLWVAFPILGNALPPIYVVGLVLKRDRELPFKPSLLAFSLLCAVYTAYIGVRALTAGSFSSAIEPTGDATSLLLTAGIALFACRKPAQICPAGLFKGLVIMLFGTFLLVLMQRVVLGEARPALLLGNPLNLTPLLLVPAILCTFTDFASSRCWAALGLVAFALVVVVVAGISMTRGPFLVLIILTLMRVIFVMAEQKTLRCRLKIAGGILFALLVGIAISFSNDKTFYRYLDMMAYSVSTTEQSQEHKQGNSEQKGSDVSSRSMDLRSMMLKAGWTAFLERPLIGHGPQYRFDAAARYLPTENEIRFSHLHNDFLTHAVAGGLPAVVLLCLILLSPILVAWRYHSNRFQRRQIGALFSTSFAGIALVNNVLFVDVSAFSLGLSFVASFLLLETMNPTSKN